MFGNKINVCDKRDTLPSDWAHCWAIKSVRYKMCMSEKMIHWVEFEGKCVASGLGAFGQ